MLKAPFPWFGGKAKVAAMVWDRFGAVRNYVEPFAGSLAVLLGRPQPFEGTETVNDADGYIANFWRALQADPDAVTEYADWPVNEADLTARHCWLVERKESLVARLFGDPDFFDAKIAGWWVWGICCWIGSGWCSGKGPWRSVEVDGVRQLVHLGDAGQGVKRKRVELLRDYLGELAARLARVRVCCGDWSRVCGRTPTVKQGLTAVFLDPPYGKADGRDSNLYSTDSLDVADECRAWASECGDDPRLRIALCGYDSFEMPEGWTCVPWKAQGGYGSQGKSAGRANAGRERIWFSPHCRPNTDKAQAACPLFAEAK